MKFKCFPGHTPQKKKKDTDIDIKTTTKQTGDAQGGGNTFPGVTRPLGLVKLGIDVYNGADAYSGYAADGAVTGFSMLHESGTGGAPKYGVVAQMPVVSRGGPVANPLVAADVQDTRVAPDEAAVGSYRTFLGSGVTVGLAAAERAGLYEYTFPAAPATDANTTNNVVVDVSHVLSSYRGQGLEQAYLGGNIEVVHNNGDDSHYYQGYGSYDNGWNRAPAWTVYFCGHFDPAPATYATFLGEGTTDQLAAYPAGDNVTSSTGARLGAVFTFNQSSTNVVTSRVGVSFLSTAQACQNVAAEIPAAVSRADLTAQTKAAWNDRVLAKVTTTDANATNKALLYTSLYHMNIIPTNKTGENPLWTSTEPYYDDIFTLWDLVTAVPPPHLPLPYLGTDH